jgi:predicted metalloprotease with PDZ domain
LEPALIHYTLQVADLNRHHFVVDCVIDQPQPDQSFSLPSWIPGSYLLREFARHIVAVEAFSRDLPVAVEKISKARWQCTGAHDQLRIRITVYAFDLSVRGSYIDGRRAFFNGPCLFLLPEGRDRDEIELLIQPPKDLRASAWLVATAMMPVDVDARGFGRYCAADYDELLDHPCEISAHASVEFEAGGVSHCLVIAGRHDTDLERVATDLRQLCASQIEFFGRPAPFASYVFLGLATRDSYGGLEHRASSSLVFCRDDLPKPGEVSVPRDYQRFLGLVSHEYFHSWHIKRTKPAAFMPYRLDGRNHTRLLWVFEGITSYYQERFLLTSGLLGVEAHLRRLAESLTRVYRVPGRFDQTLAASSFDAWDLLYKPEANSVNAGISYYSKGALVALALDLKLRQLGRTTLDQVVQVLWRRYGERGIGLPEDGFEALVEELGGGDLMPFFEQSVRGTADLELAALLDQFGLKFQLRPASGPGDRGGTAASDSGVPVALGASWMPGSVGLRLATVIEGGTARAAGLSPGDELLALDGLRVDQGNLVRRLARYEPGQRSTAAVFRDDELLECELEWLAAQPDTCVIEIDAEAGPEAVRRRRAWLGD